MRNKKIAAIVLAAGASRRLGQPKQLIKFQGDTLLNNTIGLLTAIDLGELIVITGANRNLIESSINGTTTVYNSEWQEGMASSIRAGVKFLREVDDWDGMLITLCDQPKLSIHHVRTLIETFLSKGKIVASHYNGRNGAPAVFPKSTFDDLLNVTGDKGARVLLNSREVLSIDCADCSFDIDTPEDLEKLG